MLTEFEQRRLISQSIVCLRFIQACSQPKNVEAIREFVGFSRTTADKIVGELKAAQILDKDLTINAEYAVFMGISVQYDGISISVVGLDGREFQWKEILKQNQELKEFTGKIEAEYSINGLINASGLINEIIGYVKQIFPLKAVCFSFDDVDLKNGTFTYSNYFGEVQIQEYSIHEFCKAYMHSTLKETEVQLEANTMSQLIEKEFPLKEKHNSSVYLDIQQNGCFASLLVQNKISYGYNFQSIRLSKLLNYQEKRDLESGTVNKDTLSEITKKLLSPFIIALNPELISISGSVVQDNSKVFDFIIFEKAKILEECEARDYRPKLEISLNSNYSRGTAISAMYHYYNWNGRCIKHF